MVPRCLAVLSLVAVLVGCAHTPPLIEPGLPAVPPDARFVTIPLGTAGGLDESNLSSYLLSVRGDDRWIALDAGTLYAGLRVAITRGALAGGADARASEIHKALTGRVRAVLLSHPHFDHVAGLVLNSPDDGKRTIYGSAATLDALRDHVFNGVVWANFLDEGRKPRLDRYHPVRLAPGQEVPIEGTSFAVRAFPLAHGGDGGSTAFLLRAGDDWVLYLGDTGPDEVEHSTRLAELWAQAAPLIRTRSLRAVFLECSFPNERPDTMLFSHLTPRWLRPELDRLSEAVNGPSSQPSPAPLDGIKVVVTHIKPATTPEGESSDVIRRQLEAMDGHRGARFVWPRQGEAFGF